MINFQKGSIFNSGPAKVSGESFNLAVICYSEWTSWGVFIKRAGGLDTKEDEEDTPRASVGFIRSLTQPLSSLSSDTRTHFIFKWTLGTISKPRHSGNQRAKVHAVYIFPCAALPALTSARTLFHFISFRLHLSALNCKIRQQYMIKILYERLLERSRGQLFICTVISKTYNLHFSYCVTLLLNTTVKTLLLSTASVEVCVLFCDDCKHVSLCVCAANECVWVNVSVAMT